MAYRDYEEAVRACYSTWSGDYYDNYYGRNAAYPPVHRELLQSCLRRANVRTILDAGCGPASFLRELSAEEYDLYGFDLTPEMVEEARRVLAERGVAKDHVWQGSVLDPNAFRAPGKGHPQCFDAAVCVGVLPHVSAEDDELVIRNLRTSVRDGGYVILEARNQLFSLFTLNRYSYQFFAEELIGASRPSGSLNGEGEVLDRMMEELKDRFRMDLPPIRTGKQDEPGYDEVTSRTHNPHVLREQFAGAGFEDVKLLFYHFHALPPMFERQAPEFFRQASLNMENPEDWRGYYMASAFLLTGRRA